MIKTIQPAHTKLLSLKHSAGVLTEEASGFTDTLSPAISGQFPLDADGLIEYSLATPTATTNWVASGGEYANGIHVVEIS